MIYSNKIVVWNFTFLNSQFWDEMSFISTINKNIKAKFLSLYVILSSLIVSFGVICPPFQLLDLVTLAIYVYLFPRMQEIFLKAIYRKFSSSVSP